MKYSEVHAGDAVMCIAKYGTPAKLVIDKGRFVVSRTNTRRRISWKGNDVVTDFWYQPAPQVRQSRLVVVDIRDGSLSPAVRTIPLAGVKSTCPEGSLAQILSGGRGAGPLTQVRSTHRMLVKNAADTLKGVFATLVGDDPESVPVSLTPYQYLATRPDVVNRMVLLWLRYCQQTGQSVGDGDIEPLIDEFRECTEVLATSAQILAAEEERIRIRHSVTPNDPEWMEPLRVEVLP